MGWSCILKDLIGDNGVISPLKSQDRILIPIEYLPKGCRVGDVLKFKVSFDPYGTLDLMKELESKNN